MTGSINMGSQEITSVAALRYPTATGRVIIGDTTAAASGNQSTVVGCFSSSDSSDTTCLGNGLILTSSSNGTCAGKGSLMSSSPYTILVGSGSGVYNSNYAVVAGSASSANAGPYAVCLGSWSNCTANAAHCLGTGLTNVTANSLLLDASVNIRSSSTTCNLGTSSNPFQTLYLNANVAGPTNSRTADNIVSNAGASTSGNLASFSGTTGKVITDSTIVAANVVTNSAGSTTAGQVATYSGTTGKLYHTDTRHSHERHSDQLHWAAHLDRR